MACGMALKVQRIDDGYGLVVMRRYLNSFWNAYAYGGGEGLGRVGV